MKKLIALALFATCLSASAQTYTVLGTQKCSQWGTLGTKLMTTGWIMGYVSGLNGAGVGKGNPDVLNGVNGDQLSKWMDNYCKNNPISNSLEGSKQLYEELLQRAKR